MIARRAHRTFTMLLALALLAASGISCASSKPKKKGDLQDLPAPNGMVRHEFTHPALGQDFRIVVYCPDPAAGRRAEWVAIKRMAELEETFDDREDLRPFSQVAQIHANAGIGGIRVSGELYALLRQANQIAERSHGGFDITAGPYARIWQRAVETRTMPSGAELDAAAQLVGRDKLRLDPINRTVMLLKSGARLDVSPLAPGCVCDGVLYSLKRAGFPSAMVDGGGRIAVGDAPPGRDAWVIRVIDAPPKAPHRTLRLVNQAVASSGPIGDFVRIDRQDFSRIVHPAIGKGSRNLAAVTVVASRAWQAEALARTAAVLGEGEGQAFLRTVIGAKGWYHWPKNVKRRGRKDSQPPPEEPTDARHPAETQPAPIDLGFPGLTTP
jgi:thiamine biosynthesis lipoprotein